MVQYDVTQPIAAYSTHFFPPDALVPIFITVYKTGSATLEDVAGHLLFTNHPLSGSCQDRLSADLQGIVKHFRLDQFDSILQMLKHRLDFLKQGMSMHYVGEESIGGWTTLDAGASPGLDGSLLPLVTSPKKAVKTVAGPKKAAVKKVVKKK
ncbi:MAG: hypothetical protein K8T89_05260 [Planctomycetes bacterium]|nr:hypothetical protein [Planctomycetota bacterium]